MTDLGDSRIEDSDPTSQAGTGTGEFTERWTCLGDRVIDGYLRQFWTYPRRETEAFFKKPLVPSASPGAIYDITYTVKENGQESYYTSGPKGPKFVDRLPRTDERVIRWEIEDRAANAEITRYQKERAANAERRFEERLRPIHDAYIQARDYRERAAILAAVIEIVTNGTIRTRKPK